MIWLIIALLIVISFLFSGLEAALLTISRARVRHEAREDEHPQAEKLDRLIRHRDEVLITILVINNGLNVMAFALLAYALTHAVSLPVHWGYLISFAVSLPIYILTVELLPKLIFQNFPYRLLVKFAGVLTPLQTAIGPVARAGRKLIASIWAPAERTVEDLEQGRAAFKEMTNSIQRQGTLNEDETALITQVLDFKDVTAREVMLPLKKVTAIPLEMPLLDVVNLARETDFHQFPVMSARGDLVSVVRVFDILKSNRDLERVSDLAVDPVEALPDEKALVVLQRLRRTHNELAVVKSNRGRPIGIISSIDIVQAMMRSEG